MITSVCCIYCCKQLVYLSTCLLVYSFTRLLFKVPLSFYQATCSLVYSSTCQLAYILTNKGNEKKQNRKCLYSKYLIMGIGNGMKKGYNRYFSSWIITIHLPDVYYQFINKAFILKVIRNLYTIPLSLFVS